MTSKKRMPRIGAFDALEDRVVMSTGAAQNQAIVADVSSFYSNYLATVPTLASAVTGAADATTKASATTALTTAITTDVNNLATQLLKDLGNAAAPMIRLSITGGVGGGTDVSNTSGTASTGSLLNALLAVEAVEPGVLGNSVGINLATDLTIGAAVALTAGKPSFPASNFGTFSQTYFGDVAPQAAQLKTDKAAASTPPTTAQQATIDADVAAIDKTTVADVNTLATNLLTTMGTGSTKAIQQVITGIPTTSSGVTFTSSSGTASFGSLLATLQSIETDPTLLTDANTIAGIVSLFAFI